MGKKILLSLVLTGSVTCGTVAQSVLSDNFNDSTINSSLWQTSTPFSDSSITESGGNAVFQNRGRIITTNALPTAIDITGSFEFTGNVHDNFEIFTRATDFTSNAYGYFDSGICFGFTIQGDTGDTTGNVWIQSVNYPDSSPVLVRGTYSLSQDTPYTFRITDDGSNLAFYIGDLTTPILTATDSSVYGNQLALFNREGTGGGSSISAGSVVQLDFLNVQATPEPSSACLMLGGLALIFAPRMINKHGGLIKSR